MHQSTGCCRTVWWVQWFLHCQAQEEDCRHGHLSHLSTASAYHRQPVLRHEPCPLEELSEVTDDKVVRLIDSLPAKSCPVDFMPTTMPKSNVYIMAPLISRLTNMSIRNGAFPSALKQGRVTPPLKKPGLLQSDMANYRPIMNLSTISKILEMLALHRLRPHVMSTGNFSLHTEVDIRPKQH